jgi:hypothetical protein
VGTRVGGAEKAGDFDGADSLCACLVCLHRMLACLHTQWAEEAPGDGGGCLLLAAGCLRGMHVAWRC